MTDIRTQVSRLSHVVVKNEESTEIVSAKFPDFKVIYTFPRITLVSAVNKIKRHFTMFASLTVPAVYALHTAEILSTDMSVATVAAGVILTVWLHSLGIVCNNLIGHIYLHPSNGIVILSYVDYWGRRVDLKISQVNILPVSDNQFSVTDYLFDRVMFSSQKSKLKILVKQGQIFDTQALRCVLGMVI